VTQRGEGGAAVLPFVTTVADLSRFIRVEGELTADLDRAVDLHPLRIPCFYLNLIDKDNPSCPIRKQAIPSAEELNSNGERDPLREEDYSLTPCFVKKYPGRGVFLATAQCAMYCRFCNRRRLAGKAIDLRRFWEPTFDLIERDNETREIIISGGDPLTLEPEDFDYLFSRLRKIKRIKTIRASTRVPVVDPLSLSAVHLKTLKRAAPVWVVIHVNHPREVTSEFSSLVGDLRKAGAVMVSQTVLLRGVNDCPHILGLLFESLVDLGIKPYYLFQLDEVRGASHFKVRLEWGVEIMRVLRSNISGLALPQYALDITGGLGKVPVDHQYLVRKEGGSAYVENAAGSIGIYRDDGHESTCQHCGLCNRAAF
jgi:lysine 2,3-aminomutase